MSRDEEVNKSHRLEIEIATVLLGFIFVIDSIILTMPSDVLDLIKRSGIANFLGMTLLSADVISEAGLYCSLSLLGAILLYLLYLRFLYKWILLIARSLMAVGLYLVVVLILLVNGVFMTRLVGQQANVYMNPISGYILYISLFVTVGYIFVSWGRWLWFSPTSQSIRRKLAARSRTRKEKPNQKED